MKYAVIKYSDKQIKVKEGDEILLPKINSPQKKKFDIDKVLLLVDESKVQIGRPYIPNIVVSATVLSHVKGPKVRVFKYKSKSRYRKTKGHRSLLSSIKIDKIKTQK